MPTKQHHPSKGFRTSSSPGLAVPKTTPALRYSGGNVQPDEPTKQRKAKRGFFGLLFSFSAHVGVFYLLIAALWQCSSPPLHFRYNANDARPVCRQIYAAQTNLAPHWAPLNAALQQQLEPVTKPLAPYVRVVVKSTKPYVNEAAKRSNALWKKHGEPLRKEGFKKATQSVDPYVKQAKLEYKKQYKKVQPHLDTAHAHLSPYYNIYNRDVHPYVVQGSALALSSSQRAFDIYKRDVQPRLLELLRLTQRFIVTHVLPALRTAYSKYVRPQADKVWAKVFQRKAHAVGDAAIGLAREEAREARKEGKERASRAVEEAASARRAQEDPSIMDRLNRAKDAITGKVPSHEDPVVAAALDAELEAEKQAVTEELEAWESGMLRLIETEYQLVTARIAELRQQRIDDLSNRFSQLTEDFVEDDVATALTRLERTFKKLTTDDPATLPARLDTARAFVQGQQKRLEGARVKFEQELNGYAAELEADERAAVSASTAEVRRFTEEAEKSYASAMERAKFAATEEAWEGWADGMSVRADMFEEEILALQAGEKSVRKGINATNLSRQPGIEPRIKELRKTANALYAAALKEVESFAKSGERELKREGVRYSVSDATEAVAARAKDIASGAAAVVGGAALAAKQRAGEAGEGAKSVAEQARQSARSAASGAGYSVSPEGAREHVESAYHDATTSVGAVYESIASVAKDGFNAATTSVGSVYEEAAKSAKAAVQPSSQGYFEAATSSVGSVYEEAARSAKAAVQPSSKGAFEAATSSVGSVYEEAAKSAKSALQPSSKGAFEAATTSVGQVYEELASSASSVSAAAASAAGSAYSNVASGNVASSASSLLREATRSASSVAGYSPTPETAGDYVEAAGDYVKVAYNALNDQAQAVYAAAGIVENPEAKGVVGKSPPKDFNHVGKAVGEGAEKVASAIPGAESAASIFEDAKSGAASVLAQATDAAAGGAASASSLAAVAASSASSLASVASASVGSAASVVSASGYSAAGEVGSSASSISSVASVSASSAASVASVSGSSASSVASASASSASSVASASASSASSLASKSVSSASVLASKSAAAASKSLSSASSAASASGSSFVGDSPLSSVSSALSAASASASSLAGEAASSVSSALSSISSATRSEKLQAGQTLSPEGFVESAKSVVNEALKSSTPGVVEQASSAVQSAAEAAASAASSVRNRVEL